ncbi:carboxylesterase/lipase family protein [Pseudochryseolinea flava]|uniref:Carboxylic ester hydrolase n=1 Tax=Pseudochryseolinea flava TaxID=2059302 RepID=A0A364Y2B6_9BACT|nr:carboxylesterase/lipase family protein [Pseudochryseolinea flava]RAW00822.1 carboxylesterase/lipase family protein [Pseudochryseolinea flava]
MNRRSFIKKSGLTSIGLGAVSPVLKKARCSGHAHASIVARADHAVVETTAGKIRGYQDHGIFTFKGIPYAATTALQNRFSPPKSVTPWTGIRDALAYGPICPQRPNKGWASEEYAFLFQWVDGYQGEDCLRVNVWSTRLDKHAKKPVMFWIHGGGFFSGSSQEHPSYDGRNLSAFGDVVVISVNHRLNVFGFLDLSAYGDQYAASGNGGMLDLIAALQWVKNNVENFGGDPNNVTLFGQSGGASKITTLMNMPLAKGLFHKAISQSSSVAKIASREYASALTKNVLAYLDISARNIDTLHQVDYRRLIEAAIVAEKKVSESAVGKKVPRSGWQPVMDGVIIPSHPFYPNAPEFSADVPMMIGSNRHEWSASIGDSAMEALTDEGLRKKLMERYPEKGEAFYQVCKHIYPHAKPVEILSFLNPYNPMAHVLAEVKSAQQQANVYLYMFAWETKLLDGRPRAYHCSEIPFIFYNTDRCATMTGATEEARLLSEKVAKAWINFARTGNPNHHGLPEWPAFKQSNGATMIFNNVCEVKRDPDRAFRKFYLTL